MKSIFPAFFVLVFLIGATGAHAQTADDLFNDQVLHEIRLDVHPTDWAALQQNFLLNTFYPADVHWTLNGRAVTAEQVAIRSRGTGSRNRVKPGLLLDFDRYNENVRFLGLRAMVLRNNVQDPSMLHEHIGMAFMRRMGIPAPRTAFARLFVNGSYWGVYTLVEEIDSVFLRRNFGQENGFLYEYDYPLDEPPYFFEYRGADLTRYSPSPFQPETHEDDPDAAPIEAMIRTMNQASDSQFAAAMSPFLDLALFSRYLAVEAYLAEEDGIAGNWGLNNFYLYRFEGTTRHQFIPWDKSQILRDVERSVWANVHTNVLTRRTLDTPAFRAIFRDAVAEAANTAGGSGGWMEQEIARVYALIRDAVRTDPRKLCYGADYALVSCSNEEFEAAVEYATAFARRRGDVARGHLFATGLVLPRPFVYSQSVIHE